MGRLDLLAIMFVLAASTAAATTLAPTTTCPKCVTNDVGTRTCCARGGSWYRTCGEKGDSKAEHTWDEGMRACQGELMGVERTSNWILTVVVRQGLQHLLLLCVCYRSARVRTCDARTHARNNCGHNTRRYSRHSHLEQMSQVRHQQCRQAHVLLPQRRLVQELWRSR